MSVLNWVFDLKCLLWHSSPCFYWLWLWFVVSLCLLGSKITALECLEAMASGLYSELFTLVISLINRLALIKSPNMLLYHFENKGIYKQQLLIQCLWECRFMHAFILVYAFSLRLLVSSLPFSLSPVFSCMPLSLLFIFFFKVPFKHLLSVTFVRSFDK